MQFSNTRSYPKTSLSNKDTSGMKESLKDLVDFSRRIQTAGSFEQSDSALDSVQSPCG